MSSSENDPQVGDGRNIEVGDVQTNRADDTSPSYSVASNQEPSSGPRLSGIRSMLVIPLRACARWVHNLNPNYDDPLFGFA